MRIIACSTKKLPPFRRARSRTVASNTYELHACQRHTDGRIERQHLSERPALLVANSSANWIATPVHPWEYRQIHLVEVMRIAADIVATTARLECLSYRVYGWTAFFLALGALLLAVGYWYITFARSAPGQTRACAA